MEQTLMEFSPGVGEQFGYGKQLHNILAEIHERAISKQPVSKSEIRSLVETRFHLRYTRNEPLEALRKAAVQSLERYVEMFGSKILMARAVEKPFELIDAESGALITGVVDLLERGDLRLPPSRREVVGLVDFKAKRIKTMDEYDRIASDAENQLQLYALGVQYAFSQEPQQAAAHIVSHSDLPEELRDRGLTQRIPIDISPEARGRVREKVRTTVQQIRKRLAGQNFDWTGSDNDKCRYCDFRVFCKGYIKSKATSVIGNTSPEEDRVEEMDQLMEDMNARPSAER